AKRPFRRRQNQLAAAFDQSIMALCSHRVEIGTSRPYLLGVGMAQHDRPTLRRRTVSGWKDGIADGGDGAAATIGNKRPCPCWALEFHGIYDGLAFALNVDAGFADRGERDMIDRDIVPALADHRPGRAFTAEIPEDQAPCTGCDPKIGIVILARSAVQNQIADHAMKVEAGAAIQQLSLNDAGGIGFGIALN